MNKDTRLLAASPICWLASYPKSGNTWFRLLAANAQSDPGRQMGIANLQDTGHMAASRALWEERTLLDASLMHDDEIDALRPEVHRSKAAAHDERTELVKCHDAYTQTAYGEPLLGGRRAARGALMLVRDPRDIAPSLAAHLDQTLDQAIDFMADARAGLGGVSVRGSRQLRQRLLSWSAHVTSWLDQADLPVQLIRYEDLQSDTAGMLRIGLRFAGIPTTARRVRGAVSQCDIKQLRQQELAQGFIEGQGIGRPFFRSGTIGHWRDLLTPDQVGRLEAAHGTVMRRLGYGLVAEPTRS